MGRISEEARRRYTVRAQEYRKQAEAIGTGEQTVLAAIAQHPVGAEHKRLKLAEDQLDLASLYLVLNRLHVSMLSVKNENFLNDARRACYKSVIYLEEVVGNQVDAPFSDYSDRLELFVDVSDEHRYRLIQKLGFTIRSVEDDYGDNNKWRWSFVDLEGRYAAVAKNIVNLKTLISGLDPRVPGYEARVEHLRLIKELLQRSAERYRERFEIANPRIDDFRQAMSFLFALKRIHTLVGEPDQAETISRKADVWKARMDDEEKRLEAQRSGDRPS